MDVLQICEEYGLELDHSDDRMTFVRFTDYSNNRYSFGFATHMFRGEKFLLSRCILSNIARLSAEKAEKELQSQIKSVLGINGVGED